MVLNICNEEYVIKFSTRLYADGNILDEVQALSQRSDDEGIGNLKPFLNCVVELVLAGLQKDKKHIDFHYDLDSEAEKKEKRLLVFDLLDEFVEDGGSIFDLFGQLTEELQTRGFLGNLSNKENEENEENDSTVAEK